MSKQKLRLPTPLFERIKIPLILLAYVAVSEWADPFPFSVSLPARLAVLALILFVLREFHHARCEVDEDWAGRTARVETRLRGQASRVSRRTWLKLQRAAVWALSFFVFGMMVNGLTDRCDTAVQCGVLAPRLAIENLPVFLQFMVFVSLTLFQLFIMFYAMMKVGSYKLVMPGSVGVRWEDVYGQDAALEKMKEQVSLLEDTEAVEKAGGYLPKGILLYGPPGTGKTFLAKAAAGESSKPLILIPPGAFQSTFVGINLLKIWMLFRHIRKLARRYGGVIVFLDEIDSLGSRGGQVEGLLRKSAPPEYAPGCVRWERRSDPNEPRRMVIGTAQMGTLEAFLSAMDGMEEPRGMLNRILVFAGFKPLRPYEYKYMLLGATNMPDLLDPALLRAGRFGRKIHVNYPKIEGRRRTYEGYFAKVGNDLTIANIEWAARNHARGPQPLDTPVLTRAGWLPMGDLIVGDQVIGVDGLPKTVLSIYDFPDEAEVFKVSFSDGASTRATADHLWRVSRRMGRTRRSDLATNVIVTTSELKTNSSDRDAVPLPSPPIFAVTDDLPLKPYTLGVLLGDGHLGHRTPRVVTTDSEILDRIEADGVCLRRGKTYQTKRSGKTVYPATLSVAKTNAENPYVQALRQLGLWETRSDTKFIPEPYLFAFVGERRRLLAGLLDSDGGIERKGDEHSCRAVYSTRSKSLAEGVVHLARSLGGTASLRSSTRRGDVTWTARLMLPFNPFALSRKAALWSPPTRLSRRVTGILPDGYAKVRCILIDDPSHLYVTSDFVVTHNTGAEIKDIVNEALLRTFRDDRQVPGVVHFDDVLKAMLWVKYGESDGPFERDAARWNVAVHEAGHAVAFHLLGRDRQRIWFASIDQRGEAGGMVAPTPLHEDWLLTREEMLADIQVSLASRVAEQLLIGTTTNGHGGDGVQATDTARKMVAYGHASQIGVYADDKREVRKQTEDVLGEALGSCRKLLKPRKDSIEGVAKLLYDKGTVAGDEIHDLLEKGES